MTSPFISIPKGPFVDKDTGLISREWYLWLLNPTFLTLNLGTVLGIQSGGTGINTTPADGQILIGDNGHYVLGVPSGTANQINVTLGPGTIGLSTPQDIAPTSSPSFTNLSLNGYEAYYSIANPAYPPLGQIWVHAYQNNGLDQFMFHTSDNLEVVISSDIVTIVRNTSGAPITKGQAVYITGSTGAIPNVSLAKSNASSTVAAYGLVFSSSIANNGFGRVIRKGIIQNINTSTFTTGDRLWLSPTTAGSYQNTDVSWPNFSNHIGYVLNSGVGNGSIAVDCTPTYGGNETGTINSSWTVGTGAGAGAVTLSMRNANNGVLTWTPTTARTLTLPDTTDTLAVGVSGTYTPTLTNTLNISASTAYSCQYFRLGSVVTVSGRVDIDPTAASTLTTLSISLPIASNFSAENECGGTAAVRDVAGESAAIYADATNDLALLSFTTSDTSNRAFSFSFTYRVI